MGFGGFRRSYWKNIFSQLEKYFFPSGKKTELCETCKLAKLAAPLTPPHVRARGKDLKRTVIKIENERKVPVRRANSPK